MRVTIKGQVTIPQDIRERAGFLPGTEVEFVLGDDGEVRVRRQAGQPRNAQVESAGARLRGAARGGLSTEEIMALTRS